MGKVKAVLLGGPGVETLNQRCEGLLERDQRIFGLSWRGLGNAKWYVFGDTVQENQLRRQHFQEADLRAASTRDWDK